MTAVRRALLVAGRELRAERRQPDGLVAAATFTGAAFASPTTASVMPVPIRKRGGTPVAPAPVVS
jgi:hypothetical protein